MAVLALVLHTRRSARENESAFPPSVQLRLAVNLRIYIAYRTADERSVRKITIATLCMLTMVAVVIGRRTCAKFTLLIGPNRLLRIRLR